MFLALAATLLLAVIAVQNYLYPPLRQETISDGLYGPYHWLLDGAYVILGTALVTTFATGLPHLLAILIAVCLAVTAVSNTFSGFVDRLTHGNHAKIHTWFTVLMFLTLFALEGTQKHGLVWIGVNVAAPLLTLGVLSLYKKSGILAGPAAEKVAVTVMCLWMMVQSLQMSPVLDLSQQMTMEMAQCLLTSATVTVD